ncbi:MAG: hypothetical protein ABGY72_07145 [bacterium]
MRILFSMRHPGALRNFASTLQALAERDHHVHLVFAQQDREGDARLLHQLTHDFPSIQCDQLERKSPWRFWLGLGRVARCTVDYVRYLTPEYEEIESLKERARAKVLPPIRWFVELPIFHRRTANRLLTRALLVVERAIPIDPIIYNLVARERPDVLLVTPLVDIGTDQVDFVKAARRLGFRCALPVLSWDNLTNKGLIRVQPDKVLVWNEAQKTEAVTMHGTSPDDVLVTGAMVYDQWFARRPSSTREAFCAKIRLDPARPILLYLCSSPFIAPDEVNFIEQWIAHIRSASGERVRTAGILVRPHPENLQPWHRFDAKAFDNVVVWPPRGEAPVDLESRNEFFDSMYHSAGAVGINTSAQIECGIVGRPVFSIRTPEYQRTQDGTLHFRHLITQGGGLLRIADDLDSHVGQVTAALDDPEGTRRQIERFVQAFTRPHGLDQPATPRMVEAIEQIAAAPAPRPERVPLSVYPLRAVLYPMAVLLKAARRLTRVSNKRQRQLRPITVSGMFVQTSLAVFDWLFRFRPIKNYVRQHIIPRALPRLTAVDAPTEEAVAVPRLLQKMARRERRIIVGPWVSEVGYELLYWIPFLNWVTSQHPFGPERMVVVSRGGCAAWYRDIAGDYLDLFDYYTPDQFQQKSEQRVTDGRQKQRTMTEFDRDTIKLVRQTLQARESDLLHPMYMYRLFHSFWRSRAQMSVVENFSTFRPLPPIDASDVAGALPDDYVAVRFYFNTAFPDTDANRRFVAALVSVLAETGDVVVLSPGVALDHHVEADVQTCGRVHRVSHLMSPHTNLDVQSKIIARARAFVGTHGGLSYLPPLYGVTSLSFYSDPRAFAVQHLNVARRVFNAMRPGSYVALDVTDLDTLRATLGARFEALADIAHRPVGMQQAVTPGRQGASAGLRTQ